MRPMLLGREPVAIVSAVRFLALAAITFGLSLTNEQLVASMIALEAVLAVFTRSQVAPVADTRVTETHTVDILSK